MKLLFSLIFIIHSSLVMSAEPVLRLTSQNENRAFTRSDLLKRHDLEQLKLKTDVGHPGQGITYKAIKVVNLFKGMTIAENATIQFKALDGFSAPLAKQRLLNQSEQAAIAYIAIEPEEKKWPELSKGKGPGGPFYLVWKNPELSNISPEEWPYMLAALEVRDSVSNSYPKILPDPKLANDHPAKRGLQVFIKNCFACHTINKSGEAHIGPDLNLPMNPTEYLKMSALKKLIRNPQDLRHWPESKMSAFSEKIISESELNDLIAYLKHMALNKK